MECDGWKQSQEADEVVLQFIGRHPKQVEFSLPASDKPHGQHVVGQSAEAVSVRLEVTLGAPQALVNDSNGQNTMTSFVISNPCAGLSTTASRQFLRLGRTVVRVY